MNYTIVAETDKGIVKDTNQDSILVKLADSKMGQILMAIVCDGMGGLDKGEVASASVIQAFSDWYDKELPYELVNVDMDIIAVKWELLLKEINTKIIEYGKNNGVQLGTTFTGMLFIGDEYMIVHVGDSRAYYLGNGMMQLTDDQTVVARELRSGIITKEQAEKDPRRNMLLQCIGASKSVVPQIEYGAIQDGAYLLCSDGFRHEITEDEIYESLKPINLINRECMHSNTRYLIEQVKSRQEKDNISAILIRAHRGNLL